MTFEDEMNEMRLDSDMDSDLDSDYGSEEGPPPEESSNRTFLIVAGILGAITILALICIVAYVMLYLPRQRNQQATQAAEINAQNTAVALAITQTSAAAFFTATPTETATPAADTPTPSPTPLLAVPTDTPVPTDDPRTATVAALLTQAAEAQLTAVPTSTALPSTGFAEDVGIPGLLGMAILLIVVIFLARRLRSA
ncbi:MAG: LPXTG cell wall anchor domain-containing protein [Anaerolineales bacterium]